MFKIVCMLIFVFLTMIPVDASLLKIDLEENTSNALNVIEKDSGKLLYQSKFKFQKITFNGKAFMYIQEDGVGVRGKEKTYRTWQSKAYYTVSDGIAGLYQTQLVSKNKSGQVFQTIFKNYYPKDKQAVVSINNQNKIFKMENDLIDIEFLGTALMNYPFENTKDISFHLLTNEPQVYKTNINSKGMENIFVNGKNYECYKLEMTIDLGALNIFGAFFPKTYFWYTKNSPHKFVRYEGLDSGLGTPYVVMEALAPDQ